ncbi:ferric reduction oxidase 7, chloroplastic-like [Magnolia sinica]|uniref:ferric reduction oxidase 7, chloroplastic-like n=1 Tax=Magnolia sinica TaxID=86752 RepID=UPI00265AF188|nr:ferric reduction oxidase 7, chloroplastic-like [Magnolia sinica]XP_058089934.1 ferric reduction oxidase 7, chloroplastic-like [Magnolia sinica]
MAEGSGDDVVISNTRLYDSFFKQRCSLVLLAKWVLKTAMWLIFILWIALIFLYPSDFMGKIFHKWFELTQGTFYGLDGSLFPIFSGPVILIAFLATIYVTAFPREYHKTKRPRILRFRLFTFPVIVNGPFGIVSAAELIGIILFAAYLIWAFSAYTIQNHLLISKMLLTSRERSLRMLKLTGFRLGSIGLYCLAFLFLPIARGSILLRLIDVPFEHATRYHIWLGHVTMAIFTLHGACYLVAWAMQGHFLHKIAEWKSNGISNLPGVISLLAGLSMWVTSLPPLRKRNFELFYYTHQLFVVFIVFLALHVGDFIFSIASAGIFIFLLDRFLRFCQSQNTVDVISATCLPCGTVELVLSKPRDMQYNALSFIFLRVRDLSWLQWHPFSVSSSPLDGRHHLSILVKVLGQWTKDLRDTILNAPKQPRKGLPFQPYPQIRAAVEGPYGHESPYYLMYENLILVAGGIGISPFLAILKDILHRIRESKPCLPKKVVIVWAVKRSKELHLLSMIDAESLCPSFSNKLKLDIRTYVTQEQGPVLENGDLPQCMDWSSFHDKKGSHISGLVATGNNIWSGFYFSLSTVGFFVFLTLMKAFYIKPFKITSWWFQGLLFIVCMVASIVTFGGLVVYLWHRWEKRVSSSEKCSDDNEESGLTHYNEPKLQIGLCNTNLDRLSTTQYGCRPNIQEIFDSISDRWGDVDVGVIVCGPSSLQSSVAAVCRSHNIWGSGDQPIFHCNIHSFDL